ncbi:MAG TPA: DUF1850 domain-containing protein [Bacillota bacterium]|jgi:hypothetical protein|nr:DUF1850 domain-containing protein [Bacillota bacterium]
MKKLIILIVTVIIILSFCLLPTFVLEVRVDGSEDLVFQQRARIGDFFDIQWTHSVTLQRVIETYRLEAPGRIPIFIMTFDEFGPNLPAHPEFDQYWIIEDGEFNVLGYNLVFERVPVTIGAVIADHTLVYDGRFTRLKDIYRPGGYVHIGLARKTFGQFLIEEVEIWWKGRMKAIF